jgi:hypothetical protein
MWAHGSSKDWPPRPPARTARSRAGHATSATINTSGAKTKPPCRRAWVVRLRRFQSDRRSGRGLGVDGCLLQRIDRRARLASGADARIRVLAGGQPTQPGSVSQHVARGAWPGQSRNLLGAIAATDGVHCVLQAQRVRCPLAAWARGRGAGGVGVIAADAGGVRADSRPVGCGRAKAGQTRRSSGQARTGVLRKSYSGKGRPCRWFIWGRLAAE